jgi:hypothetical protein
MATQTQVVLVDDLTGDPADTTVTFALDKTEYEIDLSNENAAEMRDRLSRYVDAARKATGGGRRSAPATKPAYTGYDSAAVRAWAAGQASRSTSAGASRQMSWTSSGPPATEPTTSDRRVPDAALPTGESPRSAELVVDPWRHLVTIAHRRGPRGVSTQVAFL